MLRNQLGTLNLRLSFGALERMPAAFALARLWIAHVDDDGPVTG
jgi:hypothetical protein